MRFKRICLNEAFSPSMPEWLRKYITSHKSLEKEIKKVSSDIDKVRSAYRKDLITWDEYQNLTSEHTAKRNELRKSLNRYDRDLGRDRYGNQGIDIFQNRNVNEKTLDLSRAKFIEQPVPKSTDPILSDVNKMCFVYLVSISDETGEVLDETVWVPNVTSQSEKFMLNNGKIMAMKQLATNNKQLQQHAKDFCYVDLTDDSNFTNQMVLDRRDAKSGVVDRAKIKKDELSQYPKSQYSGEYGVTQIDKSGYEVIPSIERYRDKLTKIRIKKFPQMVSNLRNNLIQLQRDISECNSQALLSDDSSFVVDVRRSVRDANKKFDDAISHFSNLLEQIKNINPNDLGSLPEYRLRGFLDRVKYADGYVNEAYNYIKPYMSTTIDFDEFDDSIYTDIEDDFQ